jgi:hypothetical protein
LERVQWNSDEHAAIAFERMIKNCFGTHFKLVPAVFAVVSFHSSFKEETSGRRPVVKTIAESLSPHEEKPVVPTPLSGIRVGRRRYFQSSNQRRSQIYFEMPRVKVRLTALYDIHL